MYFIIIFLLLLLLAVWVISKFLYRQIAKRTDNKIWRMMSFVPAIAVGYTIYTAVYPTEDFYKEDFKEITGIDFPANGNIRYKTASFPDQFGDYASTAVVTCSPSFYSWLQHHLQSTITTNRNEDCTNKEFSHIANETVQQSIQRCFLWEPEGGKYFWVGFLSDNQTVIVHRSSW